mmetsp:Transcript_20077/g.35721  ORF Transcript_20077/g.35721 Transcript_20077/m.35721 type:complete len:228 (-) Transcript_20077:49-732(-)
MAYGLRLINNNAPSDGTGYDFVRFGDSAFCHGKGSHGMKVKGSAPREVLRARHALQATQSACQLSLAATNSSSSSRRSVLPPRGGPGPTVLKRWHQANGRTTVNDTLGLKMEHQEEQLPSPAASLATATARLREPQPPTWEEARLNLPTMPVMKHHYYSDLGVRFATLPAVAPGTVAPKELQPDLSENAPPKYLWFSEPMTTLSCHYVEKHPSDGLGVSRQRRSLPF